MKRKVLRVSFIGERLFSFFIDYLIIFILTGVSFGLLVQVNEGVSWISLAIWGILFLLKDILSGQSIGKRIFKIAVRREIDLQKEPEKRKLILRNITTFIGLFDFIYMLFNKDNQKIGDKLAGTVVVKLIEDTEYNEEIVIEKFQESSGKGEYNRKSFLKLIIIIVILVLLFISVIFFTIVTVMKNSSAYKEALYQIQNNEKVIEQTGKIEGFGYFPNGSIATENGLGFAKLVIKVNGSKRDIHALVELHREPEEEWKVENLEILD